MIEGLKLTFSGEELRTLLEERIADHKGFADYWRHQQSRTPECQTEDEPLLPDHMCEHETKRHVWRADVLEFIRDHVDAQQTYRLGPADLEFGELLPPKPDSIEQEDYEERTAVDFQLEQLTKRLGELRCRSGATEEWAPPGYKVTRVDTGDGIETLQFERTDESE